MSEKAKRCLPHSIPTAITNRKTKIITNEKSRLLQLQGAVIFLYCHGFCADGIGVREIAQASCMEKKEERIEEKVTHEEQTVEQKKRKNVAARKTAVIVGASSGIGRETALKLSAKGYRVYNLSRTPFRGERVRTITVDASQEGELKRAIATIGEEVLAIDLLIYSAGFSMAAPIEYAGSGDYRYLFEVNYFGAIEAMRAAVPYLKKRGGRVILIGSIGGDLPIPYDSFYSSSKAALSMLAREADVELRPAGVRVSALLPGGTSTDFTYHRRVYSAEESKSYSSSVKKASAALANIEQGGMNPSLVAEAVIRLAEKKNPATVTVAGGKNMLVRYLYKMLPERVTDWMVRKKFNQN